MGLEWQFCLIRLYFVFLAFVSRYSNIRLKAFDLTRFYKKDDSYVVSSAEFVVNFWKFEKIWEMGKIKFFNFRFGVFGNFGMYFYIFSQN